ncbi:MAG: hypothetical protein AB1414_21410, partial [bacterium]
GLRCRRCFVSAGFSCGYVKFKPFRFDKKRQLKNDETTLLNSYSIFIILSPYHSYLLIPFRTLLIYSLNGYQRSNLSESVDNIIGGDKIVQVRDDKSMGRT